MLVLRVFCLGTLIFLSSLEASYYTSRPEHNALSTSRDLYSKFRPGRRVCTNSQSSTQAHVEPYYEEYSHVCGSGQICKGFRLNFRTVFSATASASAGSRPPLYSCCPGWTQTSKTHHGCHRRKVGTSNPAFVPEVTTPRAAPMCHPSCLHGGRCIERDLCHCPVGFTGSRCEHDIDECQEKNCDQMCVNTPGSFQCQCRNNFDLLEDGHSCRHNGRGVIASEAKDLEYELLENRILNLEKAIYSEKWHPKKDFEFLLNNDIDKKLERITSDSNAVKKEIMKIKNESIGYKNIVEKVKYLEFQIEKIIPYLSTITNLKLKLEKCNCHFGQGNRIKR